MGKLIFSKEQLKIVHECFGVVNKTKISEVHAENLTNERKKNFNKRVAPIKYKNTYKPKSGKQNKNIKKAKKTRKIEGIDIPIQYKFQIKRPSKNRGSGKQVPVTVIDSVVANSFISSLPSGSRKPRSNRIKKDDSNQSNTGWNDKTALKLKDELKRIKKLRDEGWID